MINEQNKKSLAGKTFLLTLVLSLIIYLPFVIYDKGYFFFLGDFNVQQIPFYRLAHDAVRSGDVLWNWNTDLGVNFIGSYSFYLLFSPFFWLTLPFPGSWVPYMIAPLLALKTACAALTSYLYIEQFTKNKFYAQIGSMLYAFSGFLIYNTFFNHFHEAVIFFPLLLIAVEELVVRNRKGLFICAVALNCIVNYWFFIGEVVFVIIYVFVRMTSVQWKMTFKKFFNIAFESVVGLAIAMVVLLPSIMAIANNPRTTADNILSGWNFWIYWADQRLPAIIQSMFFPPDLPSQPNFFPEHKAKWSSMTLWLPLVSMTGVISYVLSAKKDWLKKILITSLIFAIIPGFNSAFVLFNDSYYARWYYMPILMMCLASALAFERRNVDMNRGLRWTFGFTLLFTVAIGLTPNKVDDEYKIGLSKYPERFWGYIIIAFLCLAVTYILFKQLRDSKYFRTLLLVSVSAISVIFSWIYIGLGKCYSDNTEWIRNTAIAGRDNLITHKNTDEFFRTDIYKSMDNLGMYWNIPNIQAFHSIIPVSVMDFYPNVGVKRDVSSKPEIKYYPLRSLLSVKYYYVPQSKDNEESSMYGFEYFDEQYGFNIYKNNYYLPMGFGYDTLMTREQLMEIPKNDRSNAILGAMVVEDEEIIEKYSHIMDKLDNSYQAHNTEDEFETDVENRKAQSAYYFHKDNKGFTAKANLEKPTLMFFSVPYEEGWTAYVNGKPTDIIKANLGFMAVEIPKGECEIRFNFMPKGIKLGAIVSIIGILTAIIYVYAFKIIKKSKHKQIIKNIKANTQIKLPQNTEHQNSHTNKGDEN